MEYLIYIWMCPTLLGQAHERNGIFGEFGIWFDKSDTTLNDIQKSLVV